MSVLPVLHIAICTIHRMESMQFYPICLCHDSNMYALAHAVPRSMGMWRQRTMMRWRISLLPSPLVTMKNLTLSQRVMIHRRLPSSIWKRHPTYSLKCHHRHHLRTMSKWPVRRGWAWVRRKMLHSDVQTSAWDRVLWSPSSRPASTPILLPLRIVRRVGHLTPGRRARDL